MVIQKITKYVGIWTLMGKVCSLQLTKYFPIVMYWFQVGGLMFNTSIFFFVFISKWSKKAWTDSGVACSSPGNPSRFVRNPILFVSCEQKGCALLWATTIGPFAWTRISIFSKLSSLIVLGLVWRREKIARRQKETFLLA